MRCTVLLALILSLCCATPSALAQTSSANSDAIAQVSDWLEPERISGTVTAVLLLSALSLVPALILMTTCFVRIVIVLSLLRQALGSLGQPSNQILGALALFMTGTIMAPAARTIYGDAIAPYRAGQLTLDDAFVRAAQPVRQFMSRQIERTGNADDIWLFLEHSGQADRVQTYDDVPLTALAPAFLLSELKTAFLIGFQVYLPFLVIDLVVSVVITGLGLTALPPALVSFPAKLLLFVLVDGWHLVVGMLLGSFA